MKAIDHPVIALGISKAINAKDQKACRELLEPGEQYEFEAQFMIAGRLMVGEDTTRAPSGSPDLIIAQAIAHSGAMRDYLLGKYKESLNTEQSTVAKLRKQYAQELADIKAIKASAPRVPVSGRISHMVEALLVG
tara:strand:+ start:429 stop:833 length:405 start_codon:yes stop_codon:yes gene_type:complete